MAVPRVGNRNDIDVDDAGLPGAPQSVGTLLRDAVRQEIGARLLHLDGLRAREGAAAAPGDGGAILGAGREANLHGNFDPDRPETAEAIEYYDDLRKTVESSGAKLLVVFVPLSYCVHREDVARWSHLGVQDVAAQIAYDEALLRIPARARDLIA